MEAHTSSNQVLAEIGALTGINLGARIVQVVIFDELLNFGVQ
jgi:hypothetical protein